MFEIIFNTYRIAISIVVKPFFAASPASPLEHAYRASYRLSLICTATPITIARGAVNSSLIGHVSESPIICFLFFLDGSISPIFPRASCH